MHNQSINLTGVSSDLVELREGLRCSRDEGFWLHVLVRVVCGVGVELLEVARHHPGHVARHRTTTVQKERIRARLVRRQHQLIRVTLVKITSINNIYIMGIIAEGRGVALIPRPTKY